jgi:hypothetical protein
MTQLGLLAFSVEKAMEPIRVASIQTGGRNFLTYRLTDFGLKFVRGWRSGLVKSPDTAVYLHGHASRRASRVSTPKFSCIRAGRASM